MDVFEDLITFMTTGKASAEIAPFCCETDVRVARSAITKMLSWLKANAKSRLVRVLDLNPDHASTKHIASMVAAIGALSSLLDVKGDSLRFRSEIANDEQLAICRYVDQHFRPRIMKRGS